MTSPEWYAKAREAGWDQLHMYNRPCGNTAVHPDREVQATWALGLTTRCEDCMRVMVENDRGAAEFFASGQAHEARPSGGGEWWCPRCAMPRPTAGSFPPDADVACMACKTKCEWRATPKAPRERANYVGAPQMFDLNMACLAVTRAFGSNVYLVGSAIVCRDFRDVDVRCILDDAEFDGLFGKAASAPYNARLSLMNSAISHLLARASGLPVDFQFQRRTQADEKFDGERHPLGFFIDPEERHGE